MAKGDTYRIIMRQAVNCNFLPIITIFEPVTSATQLMNIVFAICFLMFFVKGVSFITDHDIKSILLKSLDQSQIFLRGFVVVYAQLLRPLSACSYYFVSFLY